jgi:alcohol dehydrogenase, propanol-preferring
MKALRHTGKHQPFTFEEIAEPTPAPGEVILEVEAAGLCASDLHIQEGLSPTPCPLTIGHEIAGKVVELGVGVDSRKLQPGTRAAVWLGLGAPGLERDGGMAARVAVKATDLVLVPPEVSPVIAAVATDSVATAYHAVKTTGNIRLGEKVGVIGAGGLGLNGIQIAALAGAKVVAVTRNPQREESVRKAGAHEFMTDYEKFAKSKFDCVLDFVCTNDTVQLATRSVKYGGRVVLVGLEGQKFELSPWDMILRHLTVAGSFGATQKELGEIFAYIARGALSPSVEEIKFDEAIEGYDRLRRGEVKSRLAVNMAL